MVFCSSASRSLIFSSFYFSIASSSFFSSVYFAETSSWSFGESGIQLVNWAIAALISSGVEAVVMSIFPPLTAAVAGAAEAAGVAMVAEAAGEAGVTGATTAVLVC